MTINKDTWFDVNKEGMGRVLHRRGKSFALWELIQNSLDAPGTTHVSAELWKVHRGGDLYNLVVTDDAPAGFDSLHHAYTLFGDSVKGANPELRGRFDLGEKLVLAVCEWAEIISTTGGVAFKVNGTRRAIDKRTESGSRFSGVLRMTDAEYGAATGEVRWLIVPPGITVTFNGVAVPPREPVTTFRAELPTEATDNEGVLRRRSRVTEVRLYEPLPGEPAGLVYEMGIPICPTGDRYHYDVGQRVPLGLDRAHLDWPLVRTLRVHALNATVGALSAEEKRADWVSESLGHKAVAGEAVRGVIEARFGERAVIFDPNDTEANKLSVADDRTLVHGASLSAEAWANVRRFEILKPAGKVTPSSMSTTWSGARPYEPNAAMVSVAARIVTLGKLLIDRDITVGFICEPTASNVASYSPAKGHMTFNVAHLGKRWFEPVDAAGWEAVDSLTIHELAHERAPDHLSEKYYDTLCDLGARMARIALTRPDLFRDGGPQ
jgi:hypothetical protein